MPTNAKARLVRGADAMKDYINDRIAVGRPVSRAAVYRMIENGRIPVRRVGTSGECWSTTQELDEAFGLAAPEADLSEAA